MGSNVNLRRSILFSFADRYAALALNLIAMASLARLLAPEEFGVFAIVAGVTVLIEAVREYGIGSYLIQSQSVSPEELRTAFTLSIFFSAIMASVVLVSAEPLARFYGDDRVESGLYVATLGLVCLPFSVPPIAMLRRQMRFDKIALITVCGAAAQLVISVALALGGFGYLSLVLGWVAYQAFTVLAVFVFVAARSMYRPCLVGFRDMLTFGAWSSATNVLNTLYSMYPQLLLGWVLGLEASGLINRATLVCQLQDRFVINAVQPVILPLFSARVREERSLKETYLQAAGLAFTVQLPFIVCLIVLADPVVAVLLGAQWNEVASILRILALGYGFMFAACLTYPTLVASGLVKDTLIASLISLPPAFLVIGLASPWGLEVTAGAISLCMAFQMYVALCFVRSAVGFTWREFSETTKGGMVVASCSILPPLLAFCAADFSLKISVTAGLLAGFGALLCWLAGLMLIRHPLVVEAAPWLRTSRLAALFGAASV